MHLYEQSIWYGFISTGVLCEIEKSCACQNIGEVNSTLLDEIQYYGVNNSAVNESLTSIGKWDAQSIQLLCKGKLFLKVSYLSCKQP